jgi:hypothetical protein
MIVLFILAVQQYWNIWTEKSLLNKNKTWRLTGLKRHRRDRMNRVAIK